MPGLAYLSFVSVLINGYVLSVIFAIYIKVTSTVLLTYFFQIWIMPFQKSNPPLQSDVAKTGFIGLCNLFLQKLLGNDQSIRSWRKHDRTIKVGSMGLVAYPIYSRFHWTFLNCCLSQSSLRWLYGVIWGNGSFSNIGSPRGLKHHFWNGVIQYLWWVL